MRAGINRLIMKLDAPTRFWKSGIVAGICFWLTPFIVFVRFHDYPFTHPEILAGMGILTALGIASGFLMEAAGQYSRALVFAFLITLTVDIQIQEPNRTWLLIAVGGVSLLVTFAARNYLPRVGTAILVVMLVISAVSPTGHADTRYHLAQDAPPGRPSLPVFLHIVLDEQIGVEGVPGAFDMDGRHCEALRDFYLDRGFLVFGRAYSRYDKTWATLSKAFNFDSSSYHGTRYHEKKENIFRVTGNAYFDLMRSRGYEINVYQTAYFQLCGDDTDTDVATCVTYGTEAITSIKDSPLSLGSKVRTIFGVYARLSIMMDISYRPIRLSAIAGMKVLDVLQEDLLAATPGSMYVVHLTLPHYPYAWDTDCNLRGDPSEWLTSWLRTMPPEEVGTRNNDESIAERYPLYLEQVLCTHKRLGALFAALDDAGRFEEMTILVHGDHGSRINIRGPNKELYGFRMDKTDMIASFSTLFAFKQAGTPPGYDRRVLPLGPLLESVVRDGRVPDGTEWAGTQHVYFRRAFKKEEARPMPTFSRFLRRYEPEGATR